MIRDIVGLVLISLVVTGASATAQAQTTGENAFHGPYVGAELGSIASDALIRFDGVRDPAGRGRFGFGVLGGYNYTLGSFLGGAEVSLNAATDADPFTFDPAVVGFSNLELDRGLALGLDARAGYIVAQRILLFGTLGYGVSEHEYLIDGTPLDEITGRSSSGSFGAFRYGGGIEAAIASHLHLRLIYRRFSGEGLSTEDFEPLASDAGLDHFDLELDEKQILLGILWRF